MTNLQTFKAETIKGNFITRTKEAKITVNSTTVVLHQYKNEPLDVWVIDDKTAIRVAKNMELNEAINFANSILLTIQTQNQ